jgi:multidrug efflux pump subunit AcrB
MAVTLTYGLIFGTALTLVIVPSLNLVFLDTKKLAGFEDDPGD